ncbi:hypothetical protein C8J56DRAFT_927795 [Mycena floridula]|nr:hypothetical protein C8J56DRAFT_927795 [Mycena floridula]
MPFPSSITFIPPSDPSPNLQTVLAYVQARNENDPDKIMSLMHPTLEHRILPKSLGRPVLTRQLYASYLGGFCPRFKSYKMTLHEVIEAQGMIIFHASAVGLSMQDTCFTNEYNIIMTLVPPDTDYDLPKISAVKEFVDSDAIVRFFAEEREKSARAKERGISRSQ